MEHEMFELKNAANTVEMAPSSSKTQIARTGNPKMNPKTEKNKQFWTLSKT
jgi:hypothetical protein